MELVCRTCKRSGIAIVAPADRVVGDLVQLKTNIKKPTVFFI